MEKNIQKSGSKDKQSSFGGNSIKQDISTLPEIGHFYFALTFGFCFVDIFFNLV